MTELKRVVFVEDDPDVRELIDIALNMIGGITAVGFSGGRAAAKEAASHDPQLILLDVMMPDMDGPTTLEALRSQSSLKNVPVTFLTAKVHPKEIERLRDLGADAILAKPFDPMKLADNLRAIWQEALKTAG